MPKRVLNRFKELVARKERRDAKRYTIENISRTLGTTAVTVRAWMNNEVTRYDADKILAMCEFLECEVSDLLVIEEAEEAESGNKFAALPA